MRTEQTRAATSIPVGRYVIYRSFEGRPMRRHAEGDRRKYVEMCAKSLIQAAGTNRVTSVQIVDTMYGNVVYEKHA